MAVWYEVEKALEEIVEKYEKVNHVISFFQDDKARRRGLEMANNHLGVWLELGSGPGNFTSMLLKKLNGSLICLDYSTEMLTVAKNRVKGERVDFVRGVFGALPIKQEVISLACASYALRDCIDKFRVLRDVCRALVIGGRFLIVDIGKPQNPLFEKLFSMYMHFGVPILGGLASGYGFRNPWSLLSKTYDLLLPNDKLLETLGDIFGSAKLEEHVLGGLIIAFADKKIE
jgi:demethylmenaquinone methyltransferase/2-methoxy-6-polyprenyl-1,4-benzoquinol methylase